MISDDRVFLHTDTFVYNWKKHTGHCFSRDTDTHYVILKYTDGGLVTVCFCYYDLVFFKCKFADCNSFAVYLWFTCSGHINPSRAHGDQ